MLITALLSGLLTLSGPILGDKPTQPLNSISDNILSVEGMVKTSLGEPVS